MPDQHNVPATIGIVPQVSMTAAKANRLAWIAISLALLGIIANAFTGAGWVPAKVMQISGTVALICQGISWYIARITPSMGALKVAQKNGHDEVRK